MQEQENLKNVILHDIEMVMHDSMIPYAESVILERALPRVEDGLKPVQRRILYAMHELGLTPDKPYKKSAKVVGECLAKYHPHGDSSVYEAMVHMAQPFNMGMTLVDGQGNYGSVDGDGAAAMRYTEARLNTLALETLRDIEKDTVDWENNYDDSLKEPKTLPCRYPNILVNGGMGIAVGLATNIPPHNICEVIDGAVAFIDNPKIKLDDMMQIVKGPDFPTGGFIIAGDGLKSAYETGKGKILIRSKLNVECENNGKQQIIVTQIPYQVNKAKLIQKIGQLMVDRKDEFGGIQDVVDESDRHGMRIVVKLRKDVDANDVLNLLYKNTNLQVSYGINMVMIADGKPQQLGLLSILGYYTEYQKQVVLRRTKHDLQKAKTRREIVNGLIIAVTNIDKVIQIIKKSEDTTSARQNLRKAFDLSEIQAQAILDLKLARLTRLEIDNLKDELAYLDNLIKSLQEIIDSKRKLNSVVKEELIAVKKKYKTLRRSVIVGEENDIAPERFDDEKPIENFVLGFSGKNLVRKVKLMSYSRSKVDKPTPAEVFLFSVNATSQESVYAFTNKGNIFRLIMQNIAEARGVGQGGVTFNSLFKEALTDEVPIKFFTEQEKLKGGKLVMFTKDGSIKGIEFSELEFTRTSCSAIKLKDGDSLINVELIDENKDLFFVSEQGMCLRAKNEVPLYGKTAGGVKGMDLDAGDSVVYATQINADEDIAMVGTSFGTFKKVLLGAITVTARARKGVKIVEIKNGVTDELVVFAKCVKQSEKSTLVIVDRIGAVYHVSTDEILIDGRTTKGRYVSSIGTCQPLVVYYAMR